MNLTDPSTLKALLQRHGMRPQKSWGQHFLTSRSVVDAIVARLKGYNGIVEVGPGPGVLTHELSEMARVVAVEIDPVAVSALKESAPSAEVIHQDALKLPLRPIFEDLPAPRALVSNMPYNITGPLLMVFSEVRDCYQLAVLMMQKEVGEKILAEPGDSQRGALSVNLQAQFDIKRLILAPSGAFYPPPKIDSIVLEFVPKPSTLSPENERAFVRTVRAGFSQPRKTVVNNLTSALGRNRFVVENVISELGLSPTIRPHQLTHDHWVKLSMILHEQKH